MDWSLFLTYFIACCAAGTSGALIRPGDWYDSLSKPSWTPPDWVFPAAWTTLYILMSIAGMRIAMIEGSGLAVALWSVQIAFNTLWTPVYFGLHRIRAAMCVMIGLWLSVAACNAVFFSVDTLAGLCFLPYLLWVTIAAALNFSTMQLNSQEA